MVEPAPVKCTGPGAGNARIGWLVTGTLPSGATDTEATPSFTVLVRSRSPAIVRIAAGAAEEQRALDVAHELARADARGRRDRPRRPVVRRAEDALRVEQEQRLALAIRHERHRRLPGAHGERHRFPRRAAVDGAM